MFGNGFGGMLGRVGSSIKNMFSGQGSTTDLAGSSGWCPREELSPDIIEALMMEAIMRNVVECVPDDILRAWRKFESAEEDKFYDIERKYNEGQFVHEALCMSKMYGGCAVLPMYIGDEAMLKTPLLPQDKIIGFRCIPQHLFTRDMTNPEFLRFNFEGGNRDIHISRVYLLYGKKRYDYTTMFGRTQGMRLGQSEVDLVSRHFFQMISSDQQIDGLLAKAIVDVRKQKGLMDDAEKATRSPIFAAQFNAKQQHLADAASYASNQQGIVCDMDDEDVQRLSVANGLGGLVVISERNTDLFVAATTYPRTKVLGEQIKGLNNDGGADLRRYYDRVEEYRTHKVWDLLRWLDGFIERSEGIKFPEWEFGNLWQMTQLEKVDYENKIATRDKAYYDILGDAILEPILQNLDESGTYKNLELNMEPSDGEAN